MQVCLCCDVVTCYVVNCLGKERMISGWNIPDCILWTTTADCAAGVLDLLSILSCAWLYTSWQTAKHMQEAMKALNDDSDMEAKDCLLLCLHWWTFFQNLWKDTACPFTGGCWRIKQTNGTPHCEFLILKWLPVLPCSCDPKHPTGRIASKATAHPPDRSFHANH